MLSKKKVISDFRRQVSQCLSVGFSSKERKRLRNEEPELRMGGSLGEGLKTNTSFHLAPFTSQLHINCD